MKKQVKKLTGAFLSEEHNEKLKEILKFYHRTLKGQLEQWIDFEIKIVNRSR